MKILQLFFVFTCILLTDVMAFPVNYSAVGVSNAGFVSQEKSNGNSVIHNVSNVGYIKQGGSNGNSVISDVHNTGYINQRKTNGNSIIHNVDNTNYIDQSRNTNGKDNVISNIVNRDVIYQ